MTRRLAQDALRYVSRDYAAPDAQRRKMEKRHGEKAWHIAAIEAHVIWTTHSHKECMAVLENMIEARLSACDKGGHAMTELLPCPAGCHLDHLVIGGETLRHVLCTSCGWTGASKIDKLEAIAAWNRRAPVWQPISTAPKDGTRVDLWGRNLLHHAKRGERVVNASWGRCTDWLGREREDWLTGRGEDFQPTHWRPLTPPQEPTNDA